MCQQILSSGRNCKKKADDRLWCTIHCPNSINARKQHDDKSAIDQRDDRRVGRYLRDNFPEIYMTYLCEIKGI